MKYSRVAYISIAYIKRKSKRLGVLDSYCILIRCNKCNRYIMNEYCILKGKGRQYRHYIQNNDGLLYVGFRIDA